MSMEITNNYNNYATSYATANSKKQVAEDQKSGATGETAPTRDKVADYYSNLQKNYDCVRNGKVNISGSYLKECANNPEKAKQLESDLAFYKESYENGRENAEAYLNSLGDKLVNYDETWSYDDKGNLTMTVYVQGTTETGTKDWKEFKEEQEKKLKEKREKERIEEKKKEQKEQEKKIREKMQGDDSEVKKNAEQPNTAEIKCIVEDDHEKILATQNRKNDFYCPGIDVSV